MSNHDGGYGSGLPYTNRLGRQRPSHQTRDHVRVPARSHKVATLLAVFLATVSSGRMVVLNPLTRKLRAQGSRDAPDTTYSHYRSPLFGSAVPTKARTGG